MEQRFTIGDRIKSDFGETDISMKNEWAGNMEEDYQFDVGMLLRDEPAQFCSQ